VNDNVITSPNFAKAGDIETVGSVGSTLSTVGAGPVSTKPDVKNVLSLFVSSNSVTSLKMSATA